MNTTSTVDNVADTDEPVLYIVVRTDLAMPIGKLAAQVGHAVQLAMRQAEQAVELDRDYGSLFTAWEGGSYAKIVLAAKNLAALESLMAKLREAVIPFAPVVDEGRNHVDAGTMTCIGIVPMPRSVMRPYVGRLQLLK